MATSSWVVWRRRAELSVRSGSPKLYCTLLLTILFSMYSIFLWLTYLDGPYLVFDPVDTSVGFNSPKLQEIICSRNANFCYKVEDYVYRGMYKRRLMIDQDEKVVLSVVQLVNQSELFTRANSRRWVVRKDHLVLSYSKVVVAQAFVTGTFSPTVLSSNTLMVGLGGAGISNYINSLSQQHHLTIVDIDPAMVYIAKHWFGLLPSNNQQVIIQDGVQFLARRSNWSAKFDFIIIDACHAIGKPDNLLCPENSFRQESTIQDIRRLLSDTGTLVVNTFVIDTPSNIKRMSIKRLQILDDFRKYFPSCYYAKVSANQMLTCTFNQQLIMTDTYYHKTINELPETLRRELDVKEVEISL